MGGGNSEIAAFNAAIILLTLDVLGGTLIGPPTFEMALSSIVPFLGTFSYDY